MIVWTNRFPEKEKAAGYLRLVRARMNFFDQIKPGRNGAGKFGFYRRPGFQTTLRHMRNKHQGKPGFIIGNGPSLKEMDLTPLRDQITFGANGIYQMFDEWGFHTKYLLFEDTEQTELRRKEIHNVVGPTKMAAIYNAYCFKNFDDTLFFNARRGDPYYFDEMGIQFSRDFSNIVYLGSTITYIALQLAYYLGCNPVYLIGVDHSYGALAKNFPPGKIEVTKENYELVRQCHMNPDYYQIGDVIGVPNTSLQDKAYEVAADAYKQAGREIYNAGVNSFLDAFPRTDFDSIFKKVDMTEKKRILFISHHGTMSGAPISLLTLMKHFAANRDWEFQVLMRKEGPLRSEFEKLAPTHVYYQHFLDPADMRPEGAKRPPLPEDVRRRKFRQWRHEQRLRLKLRQFKPDLVYSNTTVNGDLLAKLGIKAPTLIHVRELWTTIALYNQVQLNAFKQPDYKYFAVSEFVRNYLKDTFSIAHERIGIVPGSIEPEVFDKKAEDLTVGEMRKELALPEDAVIIGGLGSVDSRKGVDYFVDTALDVLRSEPKGRPVYFVWIGDGGMRQDMLKKVEDAGFSGRVVFPGARKNPYPYLKLFEIGLMTSRDDPFPRSVMEMAAFGAPIICFKGSGGAAEFVLDDAGIVLDDFSAADMADAVRSILANDAAKAAFAIAARRKAREDYETTRIGESAAILLDEMMASARS